ncbi:MAG: cyclic nucleotide-binding domain-containing protein [Burkholderiales bacterium]
MPDEGPVLKASDFESYAEGQVIFKEGEPGDRMYYIVAGEVNVLVRGKLVDVVKTGGILGEIALIDDKPRSATAMAKTACRLIPINRKRFAAMVQETPNFALQVMRTMADRLRQMNVQP